MTKPARAFAENDLIILTDRKGRQYLRLLSTTKRIDIRGGLIDAQAIIGQEEGLTVRASRGEYFTVFRPTLAEYILNMPRGAQVIYPKDIGPILTSADIYPGATVVEAGIGSGALTMALLRAVGPEGRVISYEIREDFARRAQTNITQFLGEVPPNLTVKIADIYQSLEETEVDRVVLDLPEPWRAVENVVRALRSGGILCSYLPTVLQVKQLVDELRERKVFTHIDTIEVLQRPWNIEGRSVRPAHRMVAHTGFLTFARRKLSIAEGIPLLRAALQ